MWLPMKSLLGKLLGPRALFSDTDTLVLGAVRGRLAPELQGRWDAQIRAVNKVQRLPENVEVDFYRMKDGRPTFDPDLAFPNRTEDLLVAKVEVNHVDSGYSLLAKVSCVNGFLFSIEYQGSTKFLDEALGMDPKLSLEVACELLADIGAAAANSL